MNSRLLRTVTKNLPTKLTEDEIRQKADHLASTVQEITAEEERQKGAKDQMKATLSELQSRQTRLALAISRREEYRDVEVRIVLSDDGKQVYEFRTDTGDLILERIPQDHERQPSLITDEKECQRR